MATVIPIDIDTDKTVVATLTCKQGQSTTWSVLFQDGGVDADLTGVEPLLQVRNTLGDLQFEQSLGDGLEVNGGRVSFDKIFPQDVKEGKYLWDFCLKFSDGHIYPYLGGQAVVTKNVAIFEA